MSLRDCINRAVRAGLMDPERADFARKLFDENYDQSRLNLGDAEALAKAREETIAIVRHQMAQMRREKLLQISRAKDILQQATTAGVPLERAMLAHMDFDPGVKGIANVSKRRDTIRGQLHQQMDEFLAKHRRDLLGRNREPAALADVLRELHGESTGNASAKQMADAWAETAERARKMFNHAGGDIPKLEGWALPHSHDFIAVRNAAGKGADPDQHFDAWFEFIKDRLDRGKMIDYSTGKPHTDLSLKAAAREAYDAITTEGWAGRELGGAYGQKLARRRTDHRFFIFKSADDWVKYHERFGSGDVFSVMMGHLDGMSRDIALLQILGPNPTATIRWMGDVIEQDLRVRASREGLATDKLESRARGARRSLESMYEHFTGAVNAPINGRAARTFAGVRSTLQSAQLGAAAISALADVGFQKMAADQVGIPFRKVLSRQLSLLSPTNIEDQKLAVRLGLIAEHWSSLAVAQQRYLGEVSGPEITQRLADFTMRVSGLSPWTQAGRWAFGMEFTGMLADHAGKAMRELPQELQDTFTRAGISPNDWEMARRTTPLEHKGAQFLRPEDMGDEDLARKFLDMIHTETEFAVPSASLRGRTLLIGENQPGTVQGELIRSFAMYKNFSITLLMTHMRRTLAMPTKYEVGRYATQLMLTTTIMGGMAMQLKELAKGRDPRDMTDPKFWGAAALQGGGLGIFGDFLFAQKNRYGDGLSSTIAGPVFGLAADVTGLINENVSRAVQGEDTKVASGVIDLAQRYAPGASLWYLRAGLQNLVFDELQRMVDPKAQQRLRRLESRYRNDYGQEHWMSRANDSMRLPDLAAAFGD